MTLSAFVTGATGFVGTHLVRELANEGWRVTALARKTSPLEDLEGLGIEFRHGDITDRDSLMDAVPDGVDAVFHVAASTNVWSPNNLLQTRINVEGTQNVVDAAMKRRAGRLVHTSSFIVWGFQSEVVTEQTRRLENADWINYVRTKWQAENVIDDAIARGLDAVILNPAHILGPGDRRNWSRVIRLVDSGSLPGIPPGGGAFSDVQEVAKAHVRAFHAGRKGERYLLGGEETKFIDVIHLAGELLGRSVPRRATPAWLLRAAARLYSFRSMLTRLEPDLTPESAAMITRHIHCDSSKAVNELGYRFTPVRPLLVGTIDWMRQKGLLQNPP
jgi:nucleoside-diphosphate-sugar epimerase